MTAIRVYLHFVIWECERHWKDVARGITNYVTLLDQLRRCRKDGEPVLLATFNYDRMIKNALKSVGVAIDSLPHYIQSETSNCLSYTALFTGGARSKRRCPKYETGLGKCGHDVANVPIEMRRQLAQVIALHEFANNDETIPVVILLVPLGKHCSVLTHTCETRVNTS